MVSPKSFQHDDAKTAKSITSGIEIAIAVNPMGFKTGNLYGAKSRTMSSNVDQKFNFKSVRIDSDEVQGVSPHAFVAKGSIGVSGAKKHPQEKADAPVAKSTESCDIYRATFGTKSAPFDVVGTR
jgi:hypothetical protein